MKSSFIRYAGKRRFDLVDAFHFSFTNPGFDLNVNIARLVVGLLILWKLLSRNFEFYGYVPPDIFDFYPVDVYPMKSYILWTGLRFITDLLTFHWIHWFFDRPGPMILKVIQYICIGLVLIFSLFGKGPKSIFLWLLYICMIYLWGHLFLLGQEVDAIAMYFGIIVMLGISKYRDFPIWRFRHLFYEKKNVNAVVTISLMYLVFISYYFASGLKKITDLNSYQWFIYDLIPTMQLEAIKSSVSSVAVPKIMENIFWLDSIGNILPAFVYLSHLVIPVFSLKEN